MQSYVPSVSEEMISIWKDSSTLRQMLLRNLENQSGMKWNIHGLLLILSALFCKSAGGASASTPSRHVCPLAQVSSTSTCPHNVEMDMFILGSDGFKGYMKTGRCEGNNWKSQTVTSSQCSSVSSGKKISVFPIVQNESCIEIPRCTTHSNDCGVSLSSYSPYKLIISRCGMPKFVCLIQGKCKNDTLTKWIEGDCQWTKEPSKYFEIDGCNITCLNPKKKCENVQYDRSCSGVNADKEGDINNIVIQNKTATCYKCGSPLQATTEIGISSNMFNTNKTEIDAVAAAETMKNLSGILSLMGNLTVASISMGDVKGVLKKIDQNESKITASYFIYSSETGISVINDLDELRNYPNAFSISEEAAEKALNQSAESAFIGVFRFPNMTKDAENSTVLNDEVYAIEMGTKVSNLSDPIILAFKKVQKIEGTPVCKSWDGNGNQPNWTSEGCSTLDNNGIITCNCTHLTFFAVLMIPSKDISGADLNTLTYITYIGCGLSLFFLSIGLFMHFLMRKAKATDSVHVLMNLFVALFLLNVAFLSNEYVARAKDITACRVMAGFMHYCLLSSFTWFGVVALHLCLQMAKHSVTIKHYIIKISVVGWAPAALVVSIIYALQKYGEQTVGTDSSNVTMCWILDSNVHYYVNIGYYCFIFIFTFTTFIVVLRWLSMLKLSRLNRVEKVQSSRTTNLDVFTILGLCCMLGLTWSFAFFGYGALRLPSYYIFTILNSLQGFFLFIYYLKASSLFGESSASEESDVTEDTNTENPYEDLPTEDPKKAM